MITKKSKREELVGKWKYYKIDVELRTGGKAQTIKKKSRRQNFGRKVKMFNENQKGEELANEQNH